MTRHRTLLRLLSMPPLHCLQSLRKLTLQWWDDARGGDDADDFGAAVGADGDMAIDDTPLVAKKVGGGEQICSLQPAGNGCKCNMGAKAPQDRIWHANI